MKCDEKIAEVSVEPKTKQVDKLNFCDSQLRFRCRRCAVFCCKLGSPKLSFKDIERLKHGRCNPDMFFDVEQTSLRSKEDGSCVFLSFDGEKGSHYRSVYDFRPTLCRLYPFQFEKSGPHTYALKFIPCCNGLNTEDGEAVDEKFFVKFLQKTLFGSN